MAVGFCELGVFSFSTCHSPSGFDLGDFHCVPGPLPHAIRCVLVAVNKLWCLETWRSVFLVVSGVEVDTLVEIPYGVE